jgi:PAS domain S-box-containing protein
MQLKLDWLIVLENLRHGIIVTDVNLEGPSGPRILYVNQAWLRMTGYARDDLNGTTPRVLQGKHTDRTVLKALKQSLLNRETFCGRLWNYRKNGQPFLMDLRCFAIYGERGKPVYYVAEQFDVTENEAWRQELRLRAERENREALRFFEVLNDRRAARPGPDSASGFFETSSRPFLRTG